MEIKQNLNKSQGFFGFVCYIVEDSDLSILFSLQYLY